MNDDNFNHHRPQLFGIAYRMLGSIADAEDVVQDAWLRWRAHRDDNIENPRAYLVRTTTRLSIDVLRERRKQRDDYPGPWLPDPLPVGLADNHDGESLVGMAETLSIGLLAVLERLTPGERAAFVLREAFGMSYADIAQSLDAPAATCRQWAKRGRDKLQGVGWESRRARIERGMLERFLAALADGDSDALVRLLDTDATLLSDGGGKVVAATRPLHGRRQISRFLLGIARAGGDDVAWRFIAMNGGWGIAVELAGKLDTVLSLSLTGDRIGGIYLVRNPDKLAAMLNPDADAAAP